MANILYRVPYQIAVRAHDLGSTKNIVNLFYTRCQVQSAAPPVYGGNIAGNGSTATALAGFQTLWQGFLDMLNVNYETVEYVMRPLLGKKYTTPSRAIAGISYSLLIRISTGTPHGLSTGDTVFIYGVTVPASVNGQWIVTVLSPTVIELQGSAPAAPWSGDGYWQRAEGVYDLLYGEPETIVASDQGEVIGEALPLFSTASVRRINAGIGRHFRSRFSLSPFSEADQVNGRWTTTKYGLLQANLATFQAATGWENGGTDPSSKFMEHVVISTQLALGLASPFQSADMFTRLCTAMLAQPNLGSLVRRKPRLTSPIA